MATATRIVCDAVDYRDSFDRRSNQLPCYVKRFVHFRENDNAPLRWQPLDSNQSALVPDLMTGEVPDGTLAWKQIVIRYQRPSLQRALWQLVKTLVPYGALWCVMFVCAAASLWLVVPLAI